MNSNATGPRKELDIFKRNLRPMQYWHIRAQDKLALWRAGVAEGYSTGLKDLDEYSQLIPGDLIVIAARPSMGKTALGVQIAEHVARQIQDEPDPGVVAIFSAEMAGWSLYLRMASARCGVSLHDLRQQTAPPADYRKLESAMGSLKQLPIWIDDNSRPTTTDMLASLKELSDTLPVRLMLFDFMELGGDREKNEEQRISSIVQNLKGIAKTLEIPVVALSQLNRSVESRANKMPALSDMRYSGMVEQIADVVFLLMRPEYYLKRGENIAVPTEDERGVAYAIVAKNRNGPVGKVRLAFAEEKMRFADLVRVPLEVPA